MSEGSFLDADFTVGRRSFDVGVTIGLAAGERLSLFGPSGAGKTTFLEAIAGLVRLARGGVRLGGELVNVAPSRRLYPAPERALEPRRRGISLVRQPTTLFPHLSVRDNVTYRLGRRRRSSEDGVGEILERVGLAGLGDVMPDRLSGGQRQRASLARALARPFRALLLDEPFSSVDGASRDALCDVALAAASAAEAVAMLVTHDLGEAQAFGQYLGIMDNGAILQVGRAEQVVRMPETSRVAELVGYTSFLEKDAEHAWALHPDRFLAGRSPDRGIVLAGRVSSVRAFGPRYACEVDLAEAALSPNRGVRVHVDVPPAIGGAFEVTALDPPLVRIVTLGRARTSTTDA